MPRFEHDGLVLWYGLEDTPAPVGSVPPGAPQSVYIGLQPPDASHRVELHYRLNQGAEETVLATWVRNDTFNNTQFYRAQLPGFRPGDTVQYGVVCYSAGRRVPGEAEAGQLPASFGIEYVEADLSSKPSSHELLPFSRQSSPSALVNAENLGPEMVPISEKILVQENPNPSLSQNTIENIVGDPERLRTAWLNLRDATVFSRLNLPNNLVSSLKKQNIYTLGDILIAGGLDGITGLPASTAARQAAQDLGAHAYLSVISTDLHANSLLINRGYTSSVLIARVPFERFLSDIVPDLDEIQARHIYTAAQVQHRLLNHTISGNIIHPFDWKDDGIPRLLQNRPCQCEDCQSVVSPAAYLTDLMDYALTHLQVYWPGFRDPQAINLQYLVDLLFQPFDQIPLSCSAAQDQVRQVRLCIEALRKYLSEQTDLLSNNPAAYPIKFAFAGDVDGDGRDEIVVAPDWSATATEIPSRQESSALWVMFYDSTTQSWQHLSPIIGHPHAADLVCGPYPYTIKSGFAADIDGDGLDELILAITKKGEIRNEFWIMKYAPDQNQWHHFSQATHPFSADLDPSSANAGVRFALGADVDGDSRAELVIAIDAPGSQGRLFWIMDFDPNTIQWRHLSPIQNHPLDADLDPAADNPTSQIQASFVVAGDFDGDGSAELAINHMSTSNPLASRFFWVLDYNANPMPGQWKHLRYDQGDVEGSAYSLPMSSPARFGVALDYDADGRDELIVGIYPAAGTDVNTLWLADFSYFEAPYNSWMWVDAGAINLTDQPTHPQAAIVVNSEGVAPGEIAVLPVYEHTSPDRKNPKNGLWVMQRNAATGQWRHQSPIIGHPLDADLDWSKTTYPAQGIFRADVDGNGRDEIVIYPAPRQSLWVFRYDAEANSWLHLAPAIDLAQADRQYLWVVYRTLLNRLGTSYEEIRLARTAEDSQRRALAQRLGILLTGPRPDNLDALLLDETTLNETKLEVLFGFMDTTRNPFANPREPSLKQWRLAYLRQNWLQEDGLIDSYANGELPVIDPDLVTPDDFRFFEPAVAGTPAALWYKRRQWIDACLKDLSELTREAVIAGQSSFFPDPEAMMNSLQIKSITYDTQQQVVWNTLASVGDVVALYTQVTVADKTKAEVAAKRIRKELHLTPDSFVRLNQIWEKDQALVTGTAPGEVTQAEWEEFSSILTQAIKAAFYPFWVQEERAWQASAGQPERQIFSPRYFWPALCEPPQGSWPPAIAAPFIDPELILYKDMPDSVVGKRSTQLWEHRCRELSSANLALQDEFKNNGLEGLLTMTFGSPPQALPWEQELQRLNYSLRSGDPAQVELAQKFIQQQLYLSLDQFHRLLYIITIFDTSQQPSKSVWSDFYTLLTTAFKLRTLYPAWKIEEAKEDLSYWQALKARLPRWRASTETRGNWLQALASRSQASVIDPDMITLDYLRPAAVNARHIYAQRLTAITTRYDLLKNQTKDLSGFERMLTLDDSLGLQANAIEAINEQRSNGDRIEKRLDQLGIGYAAFDQLERIYRLLADNTLLLNEEWEAVFAILTQVWKRRQFADWRSEEISVSLVNSPDAFQLPQPDLAVIPPLPDLPTWRATHQQLRQWTDKLQARMSQEADEIAVLSALVSESEETALPMLRDALVMASNAPGRTLADKAKWLAERMQLNTQAASCLMTTRTMQAIETIQSLLWSVRTGQLDVLDLKLYAPHFDEEWRWIGSYSTWRAAMYVYLYPENLLNPDLRKDMTPTFRNISQDMHTNARFSPDKARGAAEVYEQYYRDVCSLRMGVTSETRMYLGKQGEGNIIAKFSLAEPSGRVYWCIFDPDGAIDGDWKYWQLVPNLEHVVRVIGAVPYKVSPTERFICLFTVERQFQVERLTINKLRLETLEWSSFDLETAPGYTLSQAVVKQRSNEEEPPHLAYRAESGAVYERMMNHGANSWDGDPRIVVNPAFGQNGLDRLMAMAAITPNEFVLIASKVYHGDFGSTNALLYRIYSREWGYALDDLRWHPLGNGVFRGAFAWPKKQPHPLNPAEQIHDVVVYYDEGGGVNRGRLIKATGRYSEAINTLDEFDKWLKEVFGLQMRNTSITVENGNFEILYTFLQRMYDPRDEQFIYDLEKRWQTDPDLKEWRLAEEIFNRSDIPGGPSRFVQLLIKMLSDKKCSVRARHKGELSAVFYGVTGSTIWTAAGAQDLPLHVAFSTVSGSFTSTVERSGDIITLRQPASRIIPHVVRPLSSKADPFNIPGKLASDEAQTRAGLISSIFDMNSDGLRCVFTYLEEAYFFVPIQIGLSLSYQGHYLDALDWFRTVYDYAAPPAQRKIYAGLKQEEQLPMLGKIQTAVGWLRDPLNPHIIASTRRNTYTRFTLQSLVRCLLDYADVEFTRDTLESIARARILYTTALDLLNLPELNQSEGQCQEMASHGEITLNMKLDKRPLAIIQMLHATQRYFLADSVNSSNTESHQPELTADSPIASIWQAMQSPTSITNWEWVPTLAHDFCIPTNPLPGSLRLRTELNLYKIQTCRNIAGMERQPEPYAALVAEQTGLYSNGTTALRPTPYRYAVLIERARQTVAIAQQVESAFLAAIQSRDQEAYTYLNAMQDMRLNRASVNLLDLRVQEAESNVALARLQENRAQQEIDHYRELLYHDLSANEEAQFTVMNVSALFKMASYLINWSSYFSSMSEVFSITASGMGLSANYERRRQEWQHQSDITHQDADIASQQITIAQDHVRVVGQERTIAQMNLNNAEDSVEFLSTKFSRVDLYEWMSGVLSGVYRFFLQQATSVAQLASVQLAFERHETLPPFIQSDYWQAPGRDSNGYAGVDGNGPERRGLTGSARLLQDIYQLDQYAFETNKRKQQLTKTFSLARIAPLEFQRFQETGFLIFKSPLAMFDHDFPGHYLRLIKRVRTSVIALIPPTMGINATLTTTGTSRVVIGGDIFQTIVVRRDPEVVALTSPVNATGLFEFEQQSEMLFPFEGLGVDTTWEFHMPRAANMFDYRTIADILITIEYTALYNFDYRQQVIQTLPTALSADRAFSFRQDFPDEWYDLHNPEQESEAEQMKAVFETRRQDFPANLANLKIQQVVLYFARKDGITEEVSVTELRFFENGAAGPGPGGAATSIDGIISTRRGNASTWLPLIGRSPFGKWMLTLPSDMKNRFEREEIEDILFVITYSGGTAEWPM